MARIRHGIPLFALLLLLGCAATTPFSPPQPVDGNAAATGGGAAVRSKVFRLFGGVGSFSDSNTEELLGDSPYALGFGTKNNKGMLGYGFDTGLLFASEEHAINQTIMGINVSSMEITNVMVPLRGTIYLNLNSEAAEKGGVNPYLGLGLGVYPYFTTADLDTNYGSASEDDSGILFGGHIQGGVEFYLESNIGLFVEAAMVETSDEDFLGVEFDVSHTLFHGGLLIRF